MCAAGSRFPEPKSSNIGLLARRDADRLLFRARKSKYAGVSDPILQRGLYDL